MGKVVAILVVGVLAWMARQAFYSARSGEEQAERRKRRARDRMGDTGPPYYPSSEDGHHTSSHDHKGDDHADDDSGDGDGDGDSGGDGGGDGGDGGD